MPVTINTATKNTIPAAGDAFEDNLRTFLAEEDAERFGEIFGSLVISGGIHTTGASLTQTPSALTAYVAGFYVTESGSIVYPDNETTWVAAMKDTVIVPDGNFTRVAGTHYAIDSTSATQPSAPTNGTILMKVTTSGGSVTAVVDQRTTSLTGGSSAAGWTYSTKTADFTIANSENFTFFSVDATAGNVTATLPPSGDVGAAFVVAIKKSDSGANTVTIDGNASETLDGSATIVLSGQFDARYIISTGTGWEVIAAVGSSTSDLVLDTSPQLGGDLDANGFNILIDSGNSINDESDNEQIRFSTTASAVNEFTVTNAATGNAPELSATGGDTNIDVKLTPKGTGKFKTDNLSLDGNTIASENLNGNINLVPNGSGSTAVTGNITVTGTVDGRDVATDGTKLDGIASGAEVNPAVVSQADAEAGTATDERTWTAQRVAQAIAALESGNTTDISVVSATRDANASSGSQAVTGAGFTPTSVRITCAVDGTLIGEQYYSQGVYDGSNHTCVYRVDNSTSSETNADVSNIIHLSQDETGGSTNKAVVASLDSDGCTLTWTKSGALNPTSMRIIFEFFRN